jgi:peptidoglycan/LPS O-acetylase OafA/YrhL
VGRDVPQVLRGRDVEAPPGDAVAASERIPVVDALRLVSILLVFAIHLLVAGITRTPGSRAVNDAWVYLARNGSYGVTLFFVISGYVITRTVLRRDKQVGAIDVRGFYARRAGRILPLLLAIIATGALVMALTHPGPSPDHDPRAFCLRQPPVRFDALFWVSLLTFSFNWLRIAREHVAFGFGLHWDVMWSLAIEEQFYLGYPLLLRALGATRRVVAALALVVVAGPVSRVVAERVRPGSFLLSFTNSFAAFEQIALGALLCLLLERVARVESRAWEAALGLAGVAAMAAVYRFSSLGDPRDRLWGPTALALGACLFLYAGIRRRWLESRWTQAIAGLGQFSYSAYLLHSLVLFALWPLLVGRHPLAAISAYAALTLLAAAAVYHGFEVPVNAAVRRRLRAR